METVGLVACVSLKREQQAAARDLYISPLFVKARAFVEQRCNRWFILSALHGLVDPEDVIRPYDLTLNKLNSAERHRWASGIRSQLDVALRPRSRVILLAGVRYRDGIEDHLALREHDVIIPMRGLTIGRQLSWLSAELRDQLAAPRSPF